MIRPHYVPLFQSVCHSEKLADLKDHGARFFYTLLLTHCDAWGRTTARPRVLFSKVWAMYGAAAEVDAFLDALEKVGLIRRYDVDGEPFLCVPDWEEKAGKVGQASRRADSEIPAPPELSSTSRKGSRTPRKGSQDLAHARAGAHLGYGSATSQLGSDGEGEPGEDPPGAQTPPPVEVEDWPKAFADCEPLDKPECHAAYRRWLAWRRATGKGAWPLATLRASLTKLAPFGPAAYCASVEESVSNDWKGIFPLKGSGGSAPPKDSIRARMNAQRAQAAAPPPEEVEHADIR